MKMLGYNTGNPDTRSFDCQDLVDILICKSLLEFRSDLVMEI